MTASHTTGPWTPVTTSLRVHVEGPNGEEIASCPGDKQGLADAILIAAAPELLEALQDLEIGLIYLHGEKAASKVLVKARAAIAKATGA